LFELKLILKLFSVSKKIDDWRLLSIMNLYRNYLRLLSNRNYKAFTDFYYNYANKIAYWIYQIIHQKEDAEDLAMEIISSIPDLVKDIKDEITEEKCFNAWLYRIAKNKALNYIKRKGTLVFVPLNEDILDDEYLNSVEINPILGDQDFNISDLQKILTEEEYKIIYLKFCYNLARKDIAERLSLTERQVKRKTESAYRKIKEFIKHKGW